MREGWEYKKLGEVCEIYDKQRKPVTKSARTNGKYPYYGATGIQDYVSDYIFDGRYVLIGEDGAKWGAYEKTAFIIEGKSWVNNHAHVLSFDTTVIDSYAVYFLNYSNLDSYISGAVVRKLTQASMKSIVLPIPPISEQQTIVSELDKINEIIDLKKAQLKDLDLLAQSIFYDMFGDPIENPKGWEVKSVGSICSDVKYGTSKPACEGGKYKYLRMNNLTVDGHLDFTNLKYIDIPDTEIEKCIVRKGDILFNRTNSIDLVGKTCEFTADEPMVIAGYIIRVRLISSVHPTFFSVCFNTPAIKKLLRKIAKGAVNQANINSKELQAIAIILPPLSLQQSFADKIKAIESQKSAIKKSLAEVETLLASRMDYYFN